MLLLPLHWKSDTSAQNVNWARCLHIVFEKGKYTSSNFKSFVYFVCIWGFEGLPFLFFNIFNFDINLVETGVALMVWFHYEKTILNILECRKYQSYKLCFILKDRWGTVESCSLLSDCKTGQCHFPCIELFSPLKPRPSTNPLRKQKSIKAQHVIQKDAYKTFFSFTFLLWKLLW